MIPEKDRIRDREQLNDWISYEKSRYKMGGV